MSKQTDLAILLTELRELKASGEKRTASGKDESWYLSAIACVRDGSMTLADLQRDEVNERARQYGLPGVSAPITLDEKHAIAEEFRRRIVDALHSGERSVDIMSAAEYRDQTIGNGKPGYLQGNMGAFVSRTFFQGVKATMKWYDAILNPLVTSQIETESGNSLQVAYLSDTQSVAQVVSAENSNQAGNEQDIASVGEVDLQAYSYRTPLWRLSLEALNDLAGRGKIVFSERFLPSVSRFAALSGTFSRC